MTPIAGSVAMNLALGLVSSQVLTLFLYNKNGDERLFLTGQRLALGISFFVFLATFILAYQLVQSNFDIDYVARYTSLETPVVYKISALWAGSPVLFYFGYYIIHLYHNCNSSKSAKT
jgi:cytochrome c-type biogenesis protein CcmF